MGRATGNTQPDNEKVDSATAECPLKKNTRVPCDVESLQVEDGASGRSLKVMSSKNRVVEFAPKEAPLYIKANLLLYDAVLELLSSYTNYGGNAENAEKKNVKLKISTKTVGKCPLNKHLAIKVAPLNSLDKEDAKEWINKKPETLKIMARPHATDRSLGKWIAPFWQFGEAQVKQLVVSAESCGVLKKGKPNRALRCLVRVYRDDVYKLTFQVPAFKKIKRERKAAIDVKGTVTKESSSEHSTWGSKEYEASNKTSTTSKGVSTSTGSEKFVFDVDEQDDIKPTLSLKRNDKEVDFTKAINDILKLQEKLTESLNEIKKWVPKVGWWVEVDLSILTGEIEGSWGHRYPKTPADGARYKLVEQFYDIEFKLKLLDFSLTLGAGIDFSSPAVFDWFAGGKALEVILKAEGKLTCEVAVNKTFSSSGESDPVAVAGEGKADIYLQGKITVLAVTYEAKGGVTGGLEFKGSLVGSFLVTPQIDGMIGFVETKLYAKFVDGVREREEEFEVVIFNKKEIWKGKLPSTT